MLKGTPEPPSPDAVSAGQAVTVVSLSLARSSAGITWPGRTVAIVDLPGHFPDLFATLTEMAADAAAFWTCEDCAGEPERCGDCQSDPVKAARYREFGEALAKAAAR